FTRPPITRRSTTGPPAGGFGRLVYGGSRIGFGWAETSSRRKKRTWNRSNGGGGSRSSIDGIFSSCMTRRRGGSRWPADWRRAVREGSGFRSRRRAVDQIREILLPPLVRLFHLLVPLVAEQLFAHAAGFDVAWPGIKRQGNDNDLSAAGDLQADGFA